MDLNYYDSPKAVCQTGECRRPSLQERLENQKAELEANLVRVNAALDALKANPEVTKVLELISKV